jgi:hypothetical protein
MKKLVAFALVLSLGLFCAAGCTPAKKTDKDVKKDTTTDVKKDKDAKDAPPVTTPKDDTKKDK